MAVGTCEKLILAAAVVLGASATPAFAGDQGLVHTRWLKTRVEAALDHEHLKGVRAGVVIFQEGQTEPLVSMRGEELFTPASNMKLITTAAALCLLGEEFEFFTDVMIDAEASPPTAGSCYVIGRGDPSISGRHFENDPTARLREIARSIRSAGVRQFEGDLVIDDSYFDSVFVHSSWPEKQRSRWYCAETCALSLNDNCVDLTFVLGSSAGEPIDVLLSPNTSYVHLEGRPTTGPRRSTSRLIAERVPGSNRLRIGGTHPLGSADLTMSITIADPGLFFGHVLREVLRQEGVVFAGDVRRGACPEEPKVRRIARLKSALPRIVHTTNKRSQNLYAEQLLKTLGKERRGEGSFEAGGEVLAEFLANRIGVPRTEFRPSDGSGLSRDNRVSPLGLARLLVFMLQQPSSRSFFLSLPVSKEEGASLKKRLDSPRLRGRVAAKTGYITGSGCLSGYLRGATDETYVFCILINRDGWVSNTAMKAAQDGICRSIYEYSVRRNEGTSHDG